ncbi:MAG: TatD family hydrolase [Proteobacteria bacterium]|nr:TatD family hydrolase [Pseudomonadota bacterium]
MALADVHAHLTHSALHEQLPQVVARAHAAGLSSVVSNGLNPADNEATLELAKEHALVKPALGFYPVDVVLSDMRAHDVDYPRQDTEFSAEQGVSWLEQHAHEAFAIGEIGLDGYWVPEFLWPKQEDVFRTLVRLAIGHHKAVIIHSRKRERRAFEILQEQGAQRVNWHCFGGKVKLARAIAHEPGQYFSIPATARRSQSFTRMLQTLPRERLLLETDCPYLGPERGVANEPGNVRGTLRYAAELWGVNESEAERQFAANFEALFGVQP